MAMGNSSGISAGDIVYHITGEMSGLQGAMTESQNMAKGFGSTLIQNSTAIGTSMTVAGGAITGAMGLAAKSALTVEEALGNLRTLGVKDLDAMESGVKDLAMTYGFDLVEGLGQAYQVMSASLPEGAAIQVLDSAAKGAQAGVGTLTDALTIGRSAMNAWGLNTGEAASTAKNFEQIMGEASVAVASGSTTFAELSQAIGATAPIMASAGISTKEFFSAVSSLTATGMPASQAMNMLKASISNVQKPSEDAAKVAEALGIDFSVTGIKAEGYTAWLKKLKTALEENQTQGQANKTSLEQQITALTAIVKPTKEQRAELKELKTEYENINVVQGDNSEILAKLFGSTEAVGAMVSLTGAQHEQYTKTLEANSQAVAKLKEMSDAYANDNPALAWEKLKATLQVLSVEIGQALLPALMAIGEVIAPVIRSIAEFLREHEGFASVLTVVVASVGAFSLVLGGLILALKPIMIALTAFKVVLGVGGIATAATSATTAVVGVGTAATVATGAASGGGILGFLSALGVFVATPVGAAAVAVTVGLGSIAIASVNTKREIDKLNVSIDAVGKSDQKWAERLAARGVALDAATMAAMSHNEKVVYFAQQEKKADEELAIAYISQIQKREATEQEYQTARTLMMNKGIDAEKAAIAATMNLSKESINELLKADEKKTDTLLFGMGILTKASKMSQEDISKEYIKSAQLSYDAWNTGTSAFVDSEQRKAETVMGFWETVWNNILGLFSTPLPNTGFQDLNAALLAATPSATAAGGPAYKGVPTIMNERGQEVFVPRVDGRILTHNQTAAMMQGGGGTNNISISVNANIANDYDVSRMAQQLGEKLRHKLTGIGAAGTWRTA